MQVRIEELKKNFAEALANANSREALESLRVEYLGKKGHVAELMTQLRFAEDKKAAGQLINGLKVYVEGEIEKAQEELSAAMIAAKVRSAKKYNPTLKYEEELGSYHPITLATREVEEVFISMGFTIENYDEIVDDYKCFEALNIPKHHPARDMQDTYYLATVTSPLPPPPLT